MKKILLAIALCLLSIPAFAGVTAIAKGYNSQGQVVVALTDEHGSCGENYVAKIILLTPDGSEILAADEGCSNYLDEDTIFVDWAQLGERVLYPAAIFEGVGE